MLDVFQNMQKTIDDYEVFVDSLKAEYDKRGLEILRLTQEKGDLEMTVQSQSHAIKALNQNNVDLQGLVDRLRSLNEELRQATGGRGSSHMENGVDYERL